MAEVKQVKTHLPVKPSINFSMELYMHTHKYMQLDKYRHFVQLLLNFKCCNPPMQTKSALGKKGLCLPSC